ncbi:MAG: hypothetical protein HKN43_00085 [Rhodothermales bacterium]|nr:hypothetical protein [Rhodothermales bacterium]
MDVNIYASWMAFLLGSVTGAGLGLFFHKSDWLGGYNSWRRRLMRLGHISFFGLGLLNLGFGLTAQHFGISSGLTLASSLLLIGLFTMPTVCYLAAYRTGFRHLFFIPAGSVVIALALVAWRLVQL